MTRPWLSLAPGIAIVITVLSLNVFGDGLRDALDPRAKVKVEPLMLNVPRQTHDRRDPRHASR